MIQVGPVFFDQVIPRKSVSGQPSTAPSCVSRSVNHHHLFNFLEKFGCLRNDENISLLDVPYRDPKYEFVFLSKSTGLQIFSSINLSLILIFKIFISAIVPQLTFHGSWIVSSVVDNRSSNFLLICSHDYLFFNSQPCVPSVYTNVLAALSTETVRSAAAPLIFSEFLPTVIVFVSNVPA